MHCAVLYKLLDLEKEVRRLHDGVVDWRALIATKREG